jgi:hypothetical protein
MFMEIAIGAIGVGIVLMVGYLVVAQVKSALPVPNIANPCYNLGTVACAGQNTSVLIPDSTVSGGMASTQATVFAGFGLLAVGIIVLAAFGLINVFR